MNSLKAFLFGNGALGFSQGAFSFPTRQSAARPLHIDKLEEKSWLVMTFSAVNTIWVLVGTALVFFMQAGFSLCEAGFTRAKNTGNIFLWNKMDFCIGRRPFCL